MPKIAISSGLALVLVGITGALVAMTMVAEWWYAGIPAIIGALIAGCGWLAIKGAGARRVAMPLSWLLAVAGCVGSFMPSGLDFSSPGSVAFVSSIFRLLTIGICVGFVWLSARAFIAARKVG